ncbi:helix-turn-helix transcriptional regulator [Clostridium carnis]
MSSIGERLKYLREEANLSQIEVSNLLNMGRSTIANHENDRREPSIEMLLKYSNLYKCTVDFLVGKTNNRSNSINTFDLDDKKILAETSTKIFPNGLTTEEVLEKIKIIQYLEEKGFVFPAEIENK